RSRGKGLDTDSRDERNDGVERDRRQAMSNPLVRPGTISVRPGGAEESSAGPDWQEGGGAADLPSAHSAYASAAIMTSRSFFSRRRSKGRRPSKRELVCKKNNTLPQSSSRGSRFRTSSTS